MSIALNGDKEFIQKLTEIVLTNISDENFGVDELVNQSGLSASVLRHRLKTITQKTISQFINEVRLNKALEILQNESLTASEVAYKVGFGSPAYFNNCFHEYFGYSPGEVKKRLSVSEENHKTTEPATQTGYSAKKEKKNKKRKTRRQVFIAAATITIIAIFAWLVYLTYSDKTFGFARKNYSNVEKSIAVLPFKNIANNEDNQWFTEGVMDDIVNRLYEVRKLRVVSRTSVEQFRNTTFSAPEIAKKLGVNFLLEGSVLIYGDKVRIMVQLIDARNDRLIFTEQYDRDFKDIFIIQSTIAKLVAEKLEAELDIKEKEKIEKILTQNEEAIRYYMMGRYSIYRRMGDKGGISDGLKNGLKYFEKSISIDPGYSLAYAGLAEIYFQMAYWGDINPRSRGFETAVKYAKQALDLDRDLAEAHAVLGQIYTLANWKWEEARNEFILAIKENPNNPFLHANYAELLNILAEDKAAREQINIALKIDPTIASFHKQSTDYYFNEGKLNESLEEVNKLLEVQTTGVSNLYQQSYIYDRLNDDIHAIEALKKILKTEVPERDYSSMLDSAYQKEGSTGVCRLMLEYLMSDPNYPQLFLAQVYARLGMKKEAIECLQKSFERNEIRLPRINNDPRLVNIRREPEFREIIEKMGLGPYFNPDKDFSPVAD